MRISSFFIILSVVELNVLHLVESDFPLKKERLIKYLRKLSIIFFIDSKRRETIKLW